MKIEKIAQKLIQFKTTQERQDKMKACLDFCENYFEEEKKENRVFVRDFNNQGIMSKVISNVEGTDFDVILLGHIDTVDGDDFLFEGKIEDGKIFGRGSIDMKAFVATNMKVFKEILNEDIGDLKVALMIVTDEELGGKYGAEYLVNEIGYKAKVVLVPDDGEDIQQIVSHSKNIASFEFTAKGVEAHGCRPWDGVNAIEKNIKVYQKIKEKFPAIDGLVGSQWIDSINLGLISGGTADNEVPGESKMTLGIRWTEKKTKQDIIDIIENSLIDGVSYKIGMEAEGVFLDLDDELVKKYINILEDKTGKKVRYLKSGGGTDGRFFYYKGMTVIHHQGNGGEAQSDREYVEIDTLEKLVEIQKEFILSLNKK